MRKWNVQVPVGFSWVMRGCSHFPMCTKRLGIVVLRCTITTCFQDHRVPVSTNALPPFQPTTHKPICTFACRYVSCVVAGSHMLEAGMSACPHWKPHPGADYSPKPAPKYLLLKSFLLFQCLTVLLPQSNRYSTLRLPSYSCLWV